MSLDFFHLLNVKNFVVQYKIQASFEYCFFGEWAATINKDIKIKIIVFMAVESFGG